MEYSNEIAMYQDIMDSIGKYMEFNNYEFKIYKTWKEFDPELKEMFQKEIEILQDFGKPDITVLYKKNDEYKYKTLIIEVKLKDIVMKDIAQAKIYGDIFNADRVFLVGPKELRRKIKMYYKYNDNILKYSKDRKIKYIRLDNKNLQLQQVFPMGGNLL
jgi:hypothetical protein